MSLWNSGRLSGIAARIARAVAYPDYAERRFAMMQASARLDALRDVRERFSDLRADDVQDSQRTRFLLCEAKINSQNGEDGILMTLLNAIGAKSKTFVEVGVQDGTECNCANLALHFGWQGLMLEANSADVRRATEFYGSIDPGGQRVKVVEAIVTAENINELVRLHSQSLSVDVLSIDVDGVDYWLWAAVSVINPSIVVIEYNAYLSPAQPITVPYKASFDRFAEHSSGFYFGASVAALQRLAERKGYQLVCCDSSGVNAFFVRKDLCVGRFEQISAEHAYYPLTSGTKHRPSQKCAFELISHLPFDRV